MSVERGGSQNPAPGNERARGTYVGKKIGQCVLERKLGEGGMGVVYLARHLTLNKRVAVKILRPDLPRDLRAHDRFLKEARAAAQLEHPNIVPVYDAGKQNGMDYIVMQYIRGESLAQRLHQGPVLSLSETLRIFRAALRGILHAHESGVVHRDIKPDNILLGEDGSVKLADFGLARMLQGDPNLSGTGIFMGSPSYMSPEQATGKEVDHRTDLYSLGATLYQMLTGVPPFHAESAMGIVFKVVKESVKTPRDVNPKIPAAVSELVGRLMEKEPEKRIGSAAETLRQLQKLEGKPAERRAEKSQVSMALGVTILVVALAALATQLPFASWFDSAVPKASAEAARAKPSSAVSAPLASPPIEGEAEGRDKDE